jgi:hypothetical protein
MTNRNTLANGMKVSVANVTTNTLGAGYNSNGLGSSTSHTGKVWVYNTPTVTTSGDLTISGNSDDLFVINVTGTSRSTLNNNIILNGVTADQVLWNFTGNTNNSTEIVRTNNGSLVTLNGVFYVPADTWNFNTSVNLGGTGAGQGMRLIGSGNSSFASVIGGSVTMNAPADIATRAPRAPEPSTYLLMGAGLGALIWLRSRNRA